MCGGQAVIIIGFVIDEWFHENWSVIYMYNVKKYANVDKIDFVATQKACSYVC